MPDGPLQLSIRQVRSNWVADSRSPNNFSTNNDNPLDLQRYIIESLRKIKEINDLRSQPFYQHVAGGLNAA
jgi:hypothetical protein